MKTTSKHTLTLGCGLIRIGRVWGVESKAVPSEAEVRSFLEGAYTLGIRFFDTAPAYGLSEVRLGAFLNSLTPEQRKDTTVATKFGEHWNFDRQETHLDHSPSALLASLEQSLQRLGKIDLIQLHKATVELLTNDGVDVAFNSARTMGIKKIGVSISDLETGLHACADRRYDYIQLTYNQYRTDLLPVIKLATLQNKHILFNRPFAMGGLVLGDTNLVSKHAKMTEAFALIRSTNASGVILTGTSSLNHLIENTHCFEESTL